MEEHNYCRNPKTGSGMIKSGVWCYTNEGIGWEYCALPKCGSRLKVFDFSADNNHQPDSNGEYTSATMEVGTLPKNFTICSAFMVDAWTGLRGEREATILVLHRFGRPMGVIRLRGASSYTEYVVTFGPVDFAKRTETV